MSLDAKDDLASAELIKSTISGFDTLSHEMQEQIKSLTKNVQERVVNRVEKNLNDDYDKKIKNTFVNPEDQVMIKNEIDRRVNNNIANLEKKRKYAKQNYEKQLIYDNKTFIEVWVDKKMTHVYEKYKDVIDIDKDDGNFTTQNKMLKRDEKQIAHVPRQRGGIHLNERNQQYHHEWPIPGTRRNQYDKHSEYDKDQDYQYGR